MLKKRVVLAEDDEDDQQFFLSYLQGRQDIALMSIVQNGLMLMDHLNGIHTITEMPDFIILDQNMPKLNGLETLQLIKKESRYAHIPVVIYSTYADKNLIERCTNAGACMVATKPASKEEYDQMINSFFNICASPA